MWGRGVVWGPGGGGAGGSRWAVLGVGAQWGGVGGAAEAPFGVFNRSRGARSCPMALSARGGRGGGGSDPKWAAESGQRYGSGAGRAAGVCVCVCVWGGCGQCPPRQRLLPAPPGAPCQGRLQSCLGSAAGSCPRSQWGTRPWAARGRCRTGGGRGGVCFALLSGDPQRRRFGTRRRSARRDRSAADPSLSRVGSPPARGRNAPRGCARGGRGPGCPSAPLFSEVAPGEHSVPTPPRPPTNRTERLRGDPREPRGVFLTPASVSVVGAGGRAAARCGVWPGAA